MCSSPDCSRRLQTVSHDDVELEEGRKGKWLLELAANNDVRGLKAAVEEGGMDVNEFGRWYCRKAGSNKMGMVDRSPIMIAALFGSLEVLEYILAVHGRSDPDQINKVCSTDKSTVLHCAMASGASNASQMIHLLLNYGANPSHVDSQWLCYLDLQIAKPRKVLLDKVTPSSIESDGIDWKDILPDSVSVTSMADLDEDWGFQDAVTASDYTLSSSQTSSPTSEKGSKYKTLHDHSCDALSSDILQSSIYTTDEFRMYSFKVRPCSRAYSHDWTECPFVHPGENARRRDPRRFHYSCVPCPDFRKGACRSGDACEYAHGIFESWLHPAQYRTRLCKDGMSCTRKVCFFAHTKEELRPLFLSIECGSPSPGILSSVDVASPSSPGGAASPSAALKLVSLSPVVTNLGRSSFASSDKSSCDIWDPPSLPTLHLPEGVQASRLRTSLSARDISVNMLPDVDGPLLRELASLSTHARFNAAVTASSSSTTSSSNGKYQLNLLSTNVEDLPLAGSPRSPLQMGLQFSPRLASKFHDTGMGRVALTALEDLVAGGVGSYPRDPPPKQVHHKSSQFQQTSELGCRLQESSLGSPNHYPVVFHQRSPLSAARQASAKSGWDWGCPTGKPEWGVSGHDLTHFRSSLNALQNRGHSDAHSPFHVL